MPLKPKLSRDVLQNKVGDQNVFTFYFGPFELNRSYNSVFRQDPKPSTGFYVSDNGSTIYNDFTTGEKLDFIQFVMRLYGLNYYQAMQRIAVDFGLVDGQRSTTKPAIIKQGEAKVKVKKNYIINVTKFKKHHLDYWAQYYITEAELLANGIRAVTGITIDGYSPPINPNELKFLYTFTENNQTYFKIYTPYSTLYKFYGPVPLHLPFGLDTLQMATDTLVVTKSVKDCLVLRKYIPEVLGLQNESRSSIKKEVLNVLHTLYKRIVLWFDCDGPGKKAAEWYKQHYPWIELVFTPQQCFDKHAIKDPSDFIRHYGLEVFEAYLKTLNLHD